MINQLHEGTGLWTLFLTLIISFCPISSRKASATVLLHQLLFLLLSQFSKPCGTWQIFSLSPFLICTTHHHPPTLARLVLSVKKNLFCFALFSYFHFFLRLYFFNCIVPPKTDAERRLRRRYHSPYITSLSRCNCCTHQFSTAQNVQLSDFIVASHSIFLGDQANMRRDSPSPVSIATVGTLQEQQRLR